MGPRLGTCRGAASGHPSVRSGALARRSYKWASRDVAQYLAAVRASLNCYMTSSSDTCFTATRSRSPTLSSGKPPKIP